MLVLDFGKGVGVIYVFSSFWTFLVHSRLPPINLNFEKNSDCRGATTANAKSRLVLRFATKRRKKIRKDHQAIADIGKTNSIM